MNATEARTLTVQSNTNIDVHLRMIDMRIAYWSGRGYTWTSITAGIEFEPTTREQMRLIKQHYREKGYCIIWLPVLGWTAFW